jgi:hypothetical protein
MPPQIIATEKLCYFVKDAKFRPDGVLCMRIIGGDDDTLWDCIEEISPDSPDHKFWLWLRLRLHQYGSHEDYVSDRAVAFYRRMYDIEMRLNQSREQTPVGAAAPTHDVNQRWLNFSDQRWLSLLC